MKKGAIELHNLLTKHSCGLHLIVGHVGSGKTAALYSFCELFAPICYSNHHKMLAIYSERKPNINKQVNKGELAALFEVPMSPTCSSGIIRRRLNSIEGVDEEVFEAVRLGSLLDAIELRDYDMVCFMKLIKQVAEEGVYKSVFVDVDLNMLAFKNEDDPLAVQRKLNHSVQELSKIINKSGINLYLVAQVNRRALRNVEPISISDISTGGKSVVHLANTIFSVCLKQNKKTDLVLTTIKNRWGSTGDTYEIPFQVEL